MSCADGRQAPTICPGVFTILCRNIAVGDGQILQQHFICALMYV